MVYERDGGHAAIVDPVLGYDPVSARTSTAAADRVLAFVRDHSLNVDWILETHAHADHIRAGELPPTDANGIRYLRLPLNQLGGEA